MAKVAINGLGRIGRATLKLVLESPSLELVAVNDLIPAENLAYLLKYDTVYGRYGKEVKSTDESLIIDGKEYPLFSKKNPEELPWKELGVDIVFESTGVFTHKADLEKHVEAGAQYVILSAPAKDKEVETIVHSVNKRSGESKVFSCASCTTNCITPVAEVMDRRFGVKKAIMTTVHAYTSSQGIVDSPAKKMRRGRAAAANFVPTSTGAAKATTKALPQYKDKFDGIAIRGPVPAGSIADIVFVLEKNTTVEEVNDIFREEAESRRYKGVLCVTEDELVSSDILKRSCASIVDLSMTQVVDGDLVKVLSWYDNEWGYTSQMIREAEAIAKEA